MVNVKLGYGDRVLKTLNKDAYFGIQKDVAKLMIKNKICIAFDIENCELDFVGIDELGKEKPNFKNFNQTEIGKKLLKQDNETPVKGGKLFLKPFKILMSNKAANFFNSQKIFFAHGKINKSKNFQLDGKKTDENLFEIDSKGNRRRIVNKSIDDFRKILGKGTVWCLCHPKMEGRSLAATNPDDIKNLTPEEQKKCETYISIMKTELANLNEVPYFKESCDLVSSMTNNKDKQAKYAGLESLE